MPPRPGGPASALSGGRCSHTGCWGLPGKGCSVPSTSTSSSFGGPAARGLRGRPDSGPHTARPAHASVTGMQGGVRGQGLGRPLQWQAGMGPATCPHMATSQRRRQQTPPPPGSAPLPTRTHGDPDTLPMGRGNPRPPPQGGDSYRTGRMSRTGACPAPAPPPGCRLPWPLPSGRQGGPSSALASLLSPWRSSCGADLGGPGTARGCRV